MVGIASKFLAAQVSVIISGYASYPFDTVRRRLMMESEKPLDTRLYRGTIDCFGKIVKNEGAIRVADSRCLGHVQGSWRQHPARNRCCAGASPVWRSKQLHEGLAGAAQKLADAQFASARQ